MADEFTTAEVAALIGRTTRTVRRAAESGELPHVRRVGASYLFARSAVERWIGGRSRSGAA